MTIGDPDSLNGDMTRGAVLHSVDLEWDASPSGSVWRKRLHRVGPAESGEVTSIVRYEPGSAFPAHEHPGGEEILVLDGVFSDEHGDWPKGTYLLNPEGFLHAPYSTQGCEIFVKLRQYAGATREHVVLDVDSRPWKPSRDPGIEIKMLYEHPGFPDTTRLERWVSGTVAPLRRSEGGSEILVLEGALDDERGRHAELSWLRIPDGAEHRAKSAQGCVLYRKDGALPGLRSIR
jgi:anti-sigma factor ChrR (cupin superfamily)